MFDPIIPPGPPASNQRRIAALDLIREGDIARTLHAVGRDTDADHRALTEARRRYESICRGGAR